MREKGQLNGTQSKFWESGKDRERKGWLKIENVKDN